ncbi:MAG: inactive transglutaminase family protein [Proteobacteria bacterium]|nr:inactive transglutaminase family protein [Pseudomonadota bacterium]
MVHPQSRHILLLVLGLVLIGAACFCYRWLHLGIPLTPVTTVQSWTVEANFRFKADKKPIKAGFVIPNNPPNFLVSDENFVSHNYGVIAQKEGLNRVAQWSIRRARGSQSLYYRAVLYKSKVQKNFAQKPPEFPKLEVLKEPEKSAVESIIREARSKSADTMTFAAETLRILNDSKASNATLLLEQDRSHMNILKKAVFILAHENIPAQIAQGIYLKPEKNAKLFPWLAVYDAKKWVYLNPVDGANGLPEEFLIWQYGDFSSTDLTGGTNPHFSLSVSVTPISSAQQLGKELDSVLLKYSLYQLPLETQYVFYILLTIPIGAFIILLLRNVVGIDTFGTFMPVLIAVAFRETHLIWGVILFSTIVALGLVMRFYLEQLRLLLVPRLTAILTVVVLIILGLSVLSHKLGLAHGASIALFPMVILTMTIERMCVLWEERGAYDALKTGFGSIFAAVIAFLVMKNKELEYLMFTFPELLFILLAVVLLFGQYRGYRLLELFRFKTLAK